MHLGLVSRNTCPLHNSLFYSDGSSMAINCSAPAMGSSSSPSKRFTDLISALNSTETMQKSVMNAFALKYSKATSSTKFLVYLFLFWYFL